MMRKRSSKQGPEDLNETAFRVVAEVTGDPGTGQPEPAKNPAAVALGRLGGLKGGRARAARMTAEERSEVARQAAAARWNKR